MVHLQKDGGGLRVVDDIAGDARPLIPKIHPDPESSLHLVVDAAYQVAADHGVDTLVKLDGGSLPPAKLSAIVCLLDQVVGNEAACCPSLPGDSRLTTASDDVVSHDVSAETVDVGIVGPRRLAQDNAHAANVGDRAMLDNPTLPHPWADCTRLQFDNGRRPVSCGMQETQCP